MDTIKIGDTVTFKEDRSSVWRVRSVFEGQDGPAAGLVDPGDQNHGTAAPIAALVKLR